MVIGYCRLLENQSIDEFKQAFDLAGCEKIIIDVQTENQKIDTGLYELFQCIRSGDVLVVYSFIRCVNSFKKLTELIIRLSKKKIEFRSIKEGIDTTRDDCNYIINLFKSLDEFQYNILFERTKKGLELARARGKKGGRKKILSNDQIVELKIHYKNQDISIQELCEKYKVSRATLFRHIRK